MAIRFLVGDARETLATLPDESVQCVVTSPPYWGLRTYEGDDGMIGLEPTFDEHLTALVAVFREVRRVLRKDGTLWLNYGDAYAGAPPRLPFGDQGDDSIVEGERWTKPGKPKDLMMMPARVAMALQADGWWLRSEIVWHKPNPMPESVRDRPTSAHEKLFLLSKRARYFYDADAVRVPPQPSTLERWNQDVASQAGSTRAAGGAKTNGPMRTAGGPYRSDKQRGHSRRHDGFNDRWNHMSKAEQQSYGANLRNVWTIPPYPYRDAHFATFPPKLVEPCIKAGTREGDVVLDPFAGAGTVGLVASELGRDAILGEISPEYVEMARKRIKEHAGMFYREDSRAP